MKLINQGSLLLTTNFAFIRYIASPLASALGIKQCRKRACEHVSVLENHLKSNSYNTPDEKTMQSLSSEAGSI